MTRVATIVTPHPIIVRAYLGRGARLWLVTRLAVSVVLLRAGTNPLDFTPGSAFNLVLLSVLVAGVETVRRRELVLLGNLGVSHVQLAAMYAIPAIAGETLTHFVGSIAR